MFSKSLRSTANPPRILIASEGTSGAGSLAIFARHSERLVTHRQILTAVWGPAQSEDLQYLRVFVGQLRHKLRADLEEPDLIQIEAGIGYRLIPGVEGQSKFIEGGRADGLRSRHSRRLTRKTLQRLRRRGCPVFDARRNGRKHIA